jgi:hypothetical protein
MLFVRSGNFSIDCSLKRLCSFCSIVLIIGGGRSSILYRTEAALDYLNGNVAEGQGVLLEQNQNYLFIDVPTIVATFISFVMGIKEIYGLGD